VTELLDWEGCRLSDIRPARIVGEISRCQARMLVLVLLVAKKFDIVYFHRAQYEYKSIGQGQL
jgi:hypothetical protein